MPYRGARWSKARLFVALGLTPLIAPTASAGNGHLHHAAGAAHGALGGAGAALPEIGTLGALFVNPALLAASGEHTVEVGLELTDSDARLESGVETPFGTFSGATESDADLAMSPSFAWSHSRRDGSGPVFAMGLLTLGGFGADYPQDPTNPVLAPQPQGFGAVSARYRYVKLPFAMAWQVTPELAVGVALNGGWASLSASPFTTATPDCSGPTSCFFPAVSEDSAFGYGLQAGLHWQPTATWSFGFSYSTEQRFGDFEWHTTHADPSRPDFGTARTVEFQLDVPQIASVGVGFTPGDRLSLGLDARWIGYDGTAGFDHGFDPVTGVRRGLGWDDILVWALGVEYRWSPALALRGGWNRSESPISPDAVLANIASPAISEDHLTLGLGLRLSDGLVLDLAALRAFESEVSGAFQSPAGDVPGTSATLSSNATSVVTTLRFSF